MIDHSNFTHNLRGRSTKDSYTQWPISGRDPVTLTGSTSVYMSMFTLTAIWGIGQTQCSFEHYLVGYKNIFGYKQTTLINCMYKGFFHISDTCLTCSQSSHCSVFIYSFVCKDLSIMKSKESAAIYRQVRKCINPHYNHQPLIKKIFTLSSSILFSVSAVSDLFILSHISHMQYFVTTVADCSLTRHWRSPIGIVGYYQSWRQFVRTTFIGDMQHWSASFSQSSTILYWLYNPLYPTS